MQITLENTDFMKRAISELQKGVNDKTLFEIGNITGEAMGTFAPVQTGTLKHDYKVDTSKNYVEVYWGYKGAPTEAYAHYQYEGVVFAPNFVKIGQGPNRDGSVGVVEWRSPKGKGTKYPTSRRLGTPGSMVVSDGHGGTKTVHFGYTMAGSSDHWIVKARKTPTVYYPMRTKIKEILKLAIGERIPGRRYHV